MRKGRLVAGFIGAGLIAIVACGGSSENPPNNGGGNDAGQDVTVQDANKPDTNDANTADTNVCTVDADTSKIQDAALGEAGSVGLCLACSQTQCATESAACLADCSCAGTIECIYQNCFADLGNNVALAQCAIGNQCIAGFNLPPALTGLFTCLTSKCQDQCNLTVPDAGPTTDGGDAGHEDAGDSGHD